MRSLWGVRVHMNPTVKKNESHMVSNKDRHKWIFDSMPDGSPSCVVTKLFDFESLENFKIEGLKVEFKEEICIQYVY